MSEFESSNPVEVQLDALEDSFANAAGMASSFDAEMKRIQGTFAETGKGIQSLDASLSRSLRGAFEGVVFDGQKLSDALREVGQSMASTALNAAIKPVTNHFSGMITGGMDALFKGLMPFADGGSFAQGRVTAFANGGVVNGPTTFPMRGGTGLMGEAGPEAIMPLTRGADGKLGVQAQGGGRGASIIVNISTPDVEGFRRSQSQIAAQMSRALGRSQRTR
ncbi:phage tail tape measure protein [Planktotalea arctica]|uniref:phage tail tape measure protein n=1 Tax=Planktotalea arctica TaxID=1481893 RepID=UPI00321BBA7F